MACCKTKRSNDSKIARKFYLHKVEINGNGPMMFKRIAVDTFVTTSLSNSGIKEQLYLMDLLEDLHVHHFQGLERHKTNILFLLAIEHSCSDLDLCVNLFKAC